MTSWSRLPELVRFLSTLPGRTDLGEPAVLALLSTYSSAQALAQVPLDEVATTLERVSGGRWGREQAQALQELARPPSRVRGPWLPAVWWRGHWRNNCGTRRSHLRTGSGDC